MSNGNYIRLHLNKNRDRALIYWLCDRKKLYETAGRAMRQKLYLLMKRDKREEAARVREIRKAACSRTEESEVKDV